MDHFLPWSRWPDDRLDNLVVAHRRCNNDKRAALAAVGLLDRWWRRLAPDGPSSRQLTALGRSLDWPRQPARTAAGARGLYLHQPPGTMLWAGIGMVEPLDAVSVRAVIGRAAAAAEQPDDYDS